MATIKAIKAQSVHQIQSGQVIVDLCSVVKELVENGLDAGADSIEVRFKNHGLGLIEVQDNGSGVSPANYESVALKHHTSKLSVYDDLSSLETFGFRGEALSSLCALSTFYMVTAQADEAPKGKRLDFEVSGKLKSTAIVACQKGTIATVEGLFEALPVRRKELTKNIKREYAKVIGLLHAYACVSTGVRFSVKNTVSKGKSTPVLATKANGTARENIANIYGAKTLQGLVPLDLELDFQSTLTQISRNDVHNTRIMVSGYISKPVWGEGRQTPDRQMFFVNGRPCGLPQVTKAMNEVYKSFNVSQSPFIFADFQMDTNAYDVNVSPDKRTILLHNSAALIEKLKESLNLLFEKQDQTVPQSHLSGTKLPAFKQLSIQRTESVDAARSGASEANQAATQTANNGVGTLSGEETAEGINMRNMLHDHFGAQASTREQPEMERTKLSEDEAQKARERQAKKVAKAVAEQENAGNAFDECDDIRDIPKVSGKIEVSESDDDEAYLRNEVDKIKVRDFNNRMTEQQQPQRPSKKSPSQDFPDVNSDIDGEHSLEVSEQDNQLNVVQDAFDRVRSQRPAAEEVVITVGDRSRTTIVGSSWAISEGSRPSSQQKAKAKKPQAKTALALQFSQSLRKFGAPGTQPIGDGSEVTSDDEQIQASPSEDDGRPESSDKAEAPAEEPRRTKRLRKTTNDESDADYVDEAQEKAEEEARVVELIRIAEESATVPSKESLRRADKALRAAHSKDSTTSFVSRLEFYANTLRAELAEVHSARKEVHVDGIKPEQPEEAVGVSEEEKLSLTVTRSDFAEMNIIGQFNLGFVLAVRKASDDGTSSAQSIKHFHDELFIIDQHASDEKYNFERLQATTIVSNQRLVYSIILDLTAVEEEIVLENLPALEKNGFVVEVDTSGLCPVGQRCRLLTLPLSKEVTFDVRDLDELIHLLAESPTLNDESQVPRPAKVRKMFAMRACRSSIMIGKTLSKRQMSDVLRHMGEIDKPWNCPHGRPTMRHLTSLDVLGSWREGMGVTGEWTGDQGRIWKEYAL